MNSWFKLAIYSLIGIIIGSLALGMLAPNNGLDVNTGNFRMNMQYQVPDYQGTNSFRYGMGRMRMMFDRNAGQDQVNMDNQRNNGIGGM